MADNFNECDGSAIDIVARADALKALVGSFADDEPIDETANRALDVVYTNLTGRAMWVCVGVLMTPSDSAEAYIEKITNPAINGVFDFIANDNAFVLTTSISFLVPSGYAYSIQSGGTSSLIFWTELKL